MKVPQTFATAISATQMAEFDSACWCFRNGASASTFVVHTLGRFASIYVGVRGSRRLCIVPWRHCRAVLLEVSIRDTVKRFS
jgi:hypothetical protein